MKTKYLVVLFSIAILTFSCNKTEPLVPVCDGSTPTYDADISLILQQNCMQCHDSGASNDDYSTFASLSSVIADGSFEKEVLTDQKMPKNSSLTQDQLNTIKCWVENGYPEN